MLFILDCLVFFVPICVFRKHPPCVLVFLWIMVRYPWRQNPSVRLSLSVSCVSPPLVPIFGQFLFLSSFVIISSQPCVFSWLVPSPVLLIILFAPSFPSLYKSSVFPVSLSSINVILVCTCSPAISMFPNKVFKRSSTPPRSWHPRTSVTEYWTRKYSDLCATSTRFCFPPFFESFCFLVLLPRQWTSAGRGSSLLAVRGESPPPSAARPAGCLREIRHHSRPPQAPDHSWLT